METIGTFEAQNSREASVIRALKRAYDENVHGKLIIVSPHGARYLGQHGYYAVSTTRCTCPAGAAGLVCKHRAGYADRVGELDLLIPNFYRRAFPAPVAINPTEAARVEVDRLARNPKSTADFFALANARALLASLVESDTLVAA